MDARSTIGLAGKAAILVIVVVALGATSTAASGGRGLSMTRAETAARQAVREHPSYRGITATRTRLVTRRCWRARTASVRCSLYVVVPSPCALEGDPDRVCAQALWERRWLVSVRRERHGLTARIVKISSGPSSRTASP
jgi:hypothetical protein